MWERSCEREFETREAGRRLARGLVGDADAVAHAAHCDICRETLAVASWMQSLASVRVSDAPLPDPTYLWWKAELLRRWDAQQRASAPIEVGERLQVGVGLTSAAALLVWLWRDLVNLTASVSSLAATPLVIIMVLSGVLIAATAAVMVRDLVA